jgi:aspartyl-tRNA(Asn)/glutamyl-tRNA(Gln) amidotransferase subunit A
VQQTVAVNERLHTLRDRIAADDRRDDAVHAFLHVDNDADGDGLVVSVKDNIAVAGMPMTAGSKMLIGHQPHRDATAIERLRRTGIVVIGKTNLDEFGMGSTTEHSAFGPTRNPLDRSLVPGGSSGGAAASVAAGFCDVAIGTDTGGSVRQPAAWCGVVGVKPSYGRISRRGVVAYASSLDQIGVIAPTVSSSFGALLPMMGVDAGDATTVDVLVPTTAAAARPMRVGLLSSLLEGCAPAIVAATRQCQQAWLSSGHQVEEVDLPHRDHWVACYYVIAMAEAASNLARYDGIRFGPPATTIQAARAHFGDEVKKRLLLGNHVLTASAIDASLHQAQRVRRVLRDAMVSLLQRFDVLLLPTTTTLPPPLGTIGFDVMAAYRNDLCTLPASLAGLPAVTIPWRIKGSVIPAGIQVIAGPFDEARLWRAALTIESLEAA